MPFTLPEQLNLQEKKRKQMEKYVEENYANGTIPKEVSTSRERMAAEPENTQSEQPQRIKSKTNNNCNPKAKKISMLDIQDRDVAA